MIDGNNDWWATCDKCGTLWDDVDDLSYDENFESIEEYGCCAECCE